ncbi:hypothetical protein HYT57_05275 [Candidatus Woesearchaeota archaeon]|nr:hypothetical protein [Candidatus Woesearchaeota archaeon]
MKKISWILFAFFMIHLVLQLGALLFSFGAGMSEFDNPDSESLRIKSFIYDGVYAVLTFPVALVFYNLVFTPPLEGYFLAGWAWFLFPYILNSILWTLVFYFILKKYSKH